MRLTKFSDYSLRVLLLAASRPGKNVTIDETAKQFNISAAHLKKIVRLLSNKGILRATRGKSGGYQLGKPPEEINLGQVIRMTEPDFGMVECFLPGNTCGITRDCKLPGVINEAVYAFVEVFDRYTLADIQIDARYFTGEPLDPSDSKLYKRGPLLPPTA
jgi:Rrf2 family nitric oxide-sensitive transcriptional repressor